MAKTMMLENVAVLEIISNAAKDKDGNHTGKTYNSLVCYEFGQKYPELMKINVAPERLDAAKMLVAKRCNLIAEISVFNQKMTLHFQEGSSVQK